MRDICLQTERLTIRPMAPDEMLRASLLSPDAEMRQVYAELYAKAVELPGREELGSEWTLALADGTAVGGVCFKGAPDADGRVEIGYGIDEAYRRKGYASEAVAAVTAWALAEPDIQCVCAQTLADNAASQGVLRRNGFVRNGFGDEGPMFERRA